MTSVLILLLCFSEILTSYFVHSRAFRLTFTFVIYIEAVQGFISFHLSFVFRVLFLAQYVGLCNIDVFISCVLQSSL